jgi:RNA recognition motif-containing protein
VKKEMVKSLYVGNLPWSITEEELKQKFEEVSPVIAARVVKDQFSGRSKGFGFVEVDDANMEKAISGMNGKKLGEREIVVNEARPKEDRPEGGSRPRRPRDNF